MTTINELYLNGYGYKRIAKELKISTRLKLISNFLYKDSNIFLKRKYDRFNICPCSQ